jgi:ATP/maltotriose-dependent transcriptional regulator MalT
MVNFKELPPNVRVALLICSCVGRQTCARCNYVIGDTNEAEILARARGVFLVPRHDVLRQI